MKKQHLLILFFVFVGLFAITKGVEYLGREKTQIKVREVAKVSAERVDQIEITAAGEAIVFQKSGESWSVAVPVLYPANQAFVQSLLTTLSDLKSDNIVATNPASQASYLVDEAQGTRVVVSAGSTELSSLVIGKLSSDGNSTYVRQSGSNDIHAIRGTIRSVFVRPLTEWRDRTILSLSKDVVTNIEVVKSDGQRLELIQSADAWQLSGEAGEIDAAPIDALLAQTSLLTATGFVDDSEAAELSFDTPSITVTLTEQSGTETALSFYELENRYYLISSLATQVFEIGSYVFNAFDLVPDDLLIAAESLETPPSDSE